MAEELAEPRSIGVAISGGGHRATLWGFGVLLALVDIGLNRRVTTIASVSGGSIANGVVGKGCDYSSVDSDEIRDVVRPAIDHIMNKGLFFYGPTTNGYLTFTLGTVATAVAVWGLIVAIVTLQAFRVFVDFLGWMELEPLETLRLWPLGTAVLLAFIGLAFGAARYSGEWNWGVSAVSLLGAAAGVGLITWQLIRDPIPWDMLSALAWLTVAGVVLTALLVTLFGRRSEVAQRALEEIHFGEATLGDLCPPGGEGETRHLICATEMQSGIHAFFSDSFIYSYSFGLSTEVEQVPLAFAVQASAALPGGFSPRSLDTGPLKFTDVGEAAAPGRGKAMVLFDGGVYDNMADQWFMGLDNRRSRWPAHLSGKLPEVDDMVIANASTGWSWQPFSFLSLRIREFRELGAMTRVQSVMYNTVGRRRRAHLLDYWKAHHPDIRGAFVEVNDNPADRTSNHLKARVSAIAPPGGWESLVEATRNYPTVLRKIPRPIAMNILWHAYLITALSAHRFFDTPISDQQLPTMEEFEDSLGV